VLESPQWRAEVAVAGAAGANAPLARASGGEAGVRMAARGWHAGSGRPAFRFW
jgi:hypothetical protein